MCTILYFVYKSDHNLSGKELHRILNSFYSQFWRETVQQESERKVLPTQSTGIYQKFAKTFFSIYGSPKTQWWFIIGEYSNIIIYYNSFGETS